MKKRACPQAGRKGSGFSLQSFLPGRTKKDFRCNPSRAPPVHQFAPVIVLHHRCWEEKLTGITGVIARHADYELKTCFPCYPKMALCLATTALTNLPNNYGVLHQHDLWLLFSLAKNINEGIKIIGISKARSNNNS